MASKSPEATQFPPELNAAVADFHSDLQAASKSLSLLKNASRTEMMQRPDLAASALDRAKLDLTLAFAINSLVWMWMRTSGECPKDSEVKGELDRIKGAMMRVKEVQSRSMRTVTVDKQAAKRHVMKGLWTPPVKKPKKE